MIYWDYLLEGQTSFPEPSEFEGYNVVLLSFLVTWRAADQAAVWERLTSDERATIKQKYNDAGIKVK